MNMNTDINSNKTITMSHGSGGRSTSELIDEIFATSFDNEILSQMEDSSVVAGASKIAMTTDSFVVKPLIYPGGDIGRLSICGTVNDLLMRGSTPKYITCGFILEEGLDIQLLKQIVNSMAETAREANVLIVAGDTKVIEGNGGLMINTAGIGFIEGDRSIDATRIKHGDKIILSGNLGDHHATILKTRLSIENNLESDNAPLTDMVKNLFKEGINVHAMRDVTRGGLGTVLKEMAVKADVNMEITEQSLPVSDTVKDFCGILGLDPIYMGNEGKAVIIVPNEESENALSIVKESQYGENACIIGEILASDTEYTAGLEKSLSNGNVYMKTPIGGRRVVDVLQGEGLPRIC